MRLSSTIPWVGICGNWLGAAWQNGGVSRSRLNGKQPGPLRRLRCSYQGVNGLDFGRRDVEKRAEDCIADLVKKAMHKKISAEDTRAGFALAA
jgi:hypothetical protein